MARRWQCPLTEHFDLFAFKLSICFRSACMVMAWNNICFSELMPQPLRNSCYSTCPVFRVLPDSFICFSYYQLPWPLLWDLLLWKCTAKRHRTRMISFLSSLEFTAFWRETNTWHGEENSKTKIHYICSIITLDTALKTFFFLIDLFSTAKLNTI